MKLTVPSATGLIPAKICETCKRKLAKVKCFYPSIETRDGYSPSCRTCTGEKPVDPSVYERRPRKGKVIGFDD
jgi:hypothetical protein